MTDADLSQKNLQEWVAEHMFRMQEAQKRVQQGLALKAKDRNIRFDKSAKDQPLAVGVEVFKRNRSVKGRNKFQDAYKPERFKIIACNNQHIYLIEPVDGKEMTKWVNHTEIQPCPPKKQTTKTFRKIHTYRTSSKIKDVSYSETSSNSDEDVQIVMKRKNYLRSPTTSELSSESSGDVETLSVGETESEKSESNDIEDVLERDTVPSPQMRRTSKRQTAGKHSNPHREPRSAVSC